RQFLTPAVSKREADDLVAGAAGENDRSLGQVLALAAQPGPHLIGRLRVPVFLLDGSQQKTQALPVLKQADLTDLEPALGEPLLLAPEVGAALPGRQRRHVVIDGRARDFDDAVRSDEMHAGAGGAVELAGCLHDRSDVGGQEVWPPPAGAVVMR